MEGHICKNISVQFLNPCTFLILANSTFCYSSVTRKYLLKNEDFNIFHGIRSPRICYLGMTFHNSNVLLLAFCSGIFLICVWFVMNGRRAQPRLSVLQAGKGDTGQKARTLWNCPFHDVPLKKFLLWWAMCLMTTDMYKGNREM